MSGQKTQINVRQAAMLLITPVTATGHLLFVRIVYRYAGKDGWISLLLALVLGGAGLWVMVRLLRRHPGKNLLQIGEDLFGATLGRALGLLFVCFLLYIGAVLLRSFGDFMRLVMPATPIVVLMGVLIGLAARTCRKGLEVIARANDILLPLLIVTGATLSMLVSKDKEPRHLLPILENGWRPVWAGALSLQGLFAETVLLGFFGHALGSGRRTLPRVLWIMAILGVMFLGPVTGPTTLFGPASVRAMVYPTWEEVKHIQFADMIGNLDVMGVLLWTLGSSVQATLLLWGASNGTAWLIRSGDYRPLVTPLAIIVLALAVLVSDHGGELTRFLGAGYPLLSITVGVLLPLVMLVWTEIRLLRRG
ncbi:MAG: spore germination protein [Symbiobacteriaceae bacterium]|jgi:spore germination protein KB|nr:spore germination protein [Symbiobacteriaceae bacterium]